MHCCQFDAKGSFHTIAFARHCNPAALANFVIHVTLNTRGWCAVENEKKTGDIGVEGEVMEIRLLGKSVDGEESC